MIDPFRAPDFGEDEFFPADGAEAAEVTDVTEQSEHRERTRPSAGRRAPRRRAA
ncbi:hypothetical protein [Streptomyces sp. XY006]|uniref:hypothetical protein n=1 Tax=Streptomyces sp. XY006 TaxID=2021410 RepID=UPI00211B2C30|nr:hypothetical protein [Streptomyces sp. XY006]